MKETSHLFSILITSKPKRELSVLISPTEAIVLKLQNKSFCKRKEEIIKILCCPE